MKHNKNVLGFDWEDEISGRLDVEKIHKSSLLFYFFMLHIPSAPLCAFQTKLLLLGLHSNLPSFTNLEQWGKLVDRLVCKRGYDINDALWIIFERCLIQKNGFH